MDIQVFKECLWIAAVFISNYAVLSLRNDAIVATLTKSVKLCSEAGLLSSSNVAGDRTLYFTKSYNASKIESCVVAENGSTTNSVAANVGAFRGMDGHTGAIAVTHNLLIVVHDQTVCVFDRANQHRLLGSVCVDGSLFGLTSVLSTGVGALLSLSLTIPRRVRQQSMREGTGECITMILDVCLVRFMFVFVVVFFNR